VRGRTFGRELAAITTLSWASGRSVFPARSGRSLERLGYKVGIEAIDPGAGELLPVATAS
jgi:hypothetical protein